MYLIWTCWCSAAAGAACVHRLAAVAPVAGTSTAPAGAANTARSSLLYKLGAGLKAGWDNNNKDDTDDNDDNV